MTQESLTEKLAKHLMRPVDEDMRQRARLHLLDWLGSVAGARQSEVAEVALKAEPDVLTRAALLGNVLEMDDVHRTSILHPGPAVWPSVLSAVRDVDGEMEKLLEGAVVGYEATIAIGSTFDSAHYAYYHNTSTAGGFGAAAGAGKVFEFSDNQYVHALGNAGSVAGGFWQMRHENVMTKQMHVTHAALVGLWHARLAKQGFSGPRFILEGPQGLYAATCDQPLPMTFPDQWRIHEVSFKPWGACRHAHPAIDAALELKQKTGALEGEILVETYADALNFCDGPDPETVLDAKFSLQHAVAVVAQKGIPELADFQSDTIKKFAEVRSKVKVKESSNFTARYPEHYGARVTCGEETVELADTLGDPERPMSRDQIVGKAHELIGWGGLSNAEADRAVELTLDGDDVGAILKMLTEWLS